MREKEGRHIIPDWLIYFLKGVVTLLTRLRQVTIRIEETIEENMRIISSLRSAHIIFINYSALTIKSIEINDNNVIILRIIFILSILFTT